MASSDGGGTRGGVGFLGMLCLLFVGLRLANVIDWPWWVVLSPLWVPVALIVALCAAFVVMSRR